VINTFDPKRPQSEKLVAMLKDLGEPKSLGRLAVMRPEDYPTLVHFRDIRDPKTVALVDPGDLARSFGAGVKLRRIVLTITDKPVTTGNAKRLKWLSQTLNTQLDGSRYHESTKFSNSLNSLDFKSLDIDR
jgi:hypothetical protein